MHCPACTHELKKSTESGIELDECPACGGIWFDEGELPSIVNLGANAVAEAETSSRAEVPEGERVSDRFCPNCSVHLDTYIYNYERASIELDVCRQCGGIWLDHGELSAIAAFITAEEAEGLKTPKVLGAAVTESETHSKESLTGRIRNAGKFLKSRLGHWSK